MNRRRRWLIVIGVIVVGSVVTPMLRSRAIAAATMIRALGVDVYLPFAPDPEPFVTDVGGVRGLIYELDEAPSVILVPGATPAGVEDSRVRSVARSLARAGRTVFIPQLDLYEERFTDADIGRIVDATIELSRLSGHPVVIAGFSYGGSFALVAAADPRVEGHISRIATLGAYFDLVGVVQAVTTGLSVVEAREIPWDGDPRAEDFLARRTGELLSKPDREALAAALDGRLGRRELSGDARSLYDLLVNEDPSNTPQLVEELPKSLRTLIERFSPATVADRITVPVLAMHSTDDPLVPYAELARLDRGLPQAETVTVELFRHVDVSVGDRPARWSLVPDLWRLWDFTTWVLAG